MATSSEIKWLEDYFTLEDNEIICDFCKNSYGIIINVEDVKKHLVTHKGYENVALSLKKEDGKKYYTIHNNTIKCKLCDELYTSWNTHSIIKYHLEIGHETNEDKVEKTNKWIREKYTLNESDATKQYCKQCKEGIQNKLVHLIFHLDSDHKDEDCSEHRPINEIKTNRLDNIFDNWMWNYYIRDGEYAQCSICNNKCDYKFLRKSNTEVIEHLKDQHTHISPRLIKGSRQLTKQNYTEIQDGRVKCNICYVVFEQALYINDNVRTHLKEVHYITCEQSEVLRKWVFEHIYKLVGFQNSQCKHCNKGNKLQKMCVFDIFKHLIKDHRIETPPKISSMRVCKEFIDSLSTDENVKNIPTSSDPQPGSSKSSDIEVRDVNYDRDSRMENLKRKSSSLLSSDKNVKYTATSSMDSQPGCSKFLDIDDRSSGKRVKYDDDKRLPDELITRSNLSNPLQFGEDSITMSSIDEEPIWSNLRTSSDDSEPTLINIDMNPPTDRDENITPKDKDEN